jgi:hypothetical protein
MTFARFVLAGVLLMAIVIAWLIYEFRADNRDRIYPTAAGRQERLPPSKVCGV